MPIRKKFKTDKERILSNFDYIDLARGKAIQTMYGAKTYTYVAMGADIPVFILSESIIWSETVEEIHTNSGNKANTKEHDDDYDVKFDLPRIVGGTAIINVPTGTYRYGTGSPQSATYYVIAKIRKYSGVTETELASIESTHITVTEYHAARTEYFFCLKVDIPKTKFKAGDILRVTIELWSSSSATAAGRTTIGYTHSPQNRTPEYGLTHMTNTRLHAHIPFKIDL